jgi:hypothetical protein
MASKIGQIADPHAAYWHIAKFLSAHPRYRGEPFWKMRLLQQAISLGNYRCMSDGRTMQAVATWRGINAALLLRTYPRYPADSSEPIDGMFLSSLAAVDQETAKTMIRYLRTSFSDKDVFWDRHNGKLGHRPRKPRVEIAS